MNFDLNTSKKVQEVIFKRKVDEIDHALLLFHQNLVKSTSTQKHFGMVLDTELDLDLHLKNFKNKTTQ